MKGFEEKELMDSKEKKAIYFYLVFVIIITLFLISIVITLISYRKKLLKIPCNLFACSLLLAHILNAIFLITLTCYFIKYNWIPEQMLKPPKNLENSAFLFIYDVIVSLKILISTNVILLTVDRFISLYLHLRYNVWLTRKKQYIFIALAWFFPVVVFIISETLKRLIQVLILLSVITICLLLLTVFNVYIFLKVRHHLKAMRRTSINTREQVSLDRKEKRAIEFTLIIVASYMIAFIPEVIDKLLSIFEETSDELVFVNGFLFAINSLLDALVYVVLNSDIRESYRKLFCFLRCRQHQSVDSHDSERRKRTHVENTNGKTEENIC